ncbi:hypothetical protein R1sor_007216 [Riccia sorocarpa]|uniref:Glutathione S-transferase n=1 Tax=Riccia sorocarpa TaxID=122646 RepID=A0ABD3HTF7_9MARC
MWETEFSSDSIVSLATTVAAGASHYCEKARWALDRAAIIYKESKHVVLLHMFFTRGLGGTSCPKLVMGSGSDRVVLQESSDILRFAEKNIKREEDRLYPDDPVMFKAVEAWETKLGKKLGPHVRRWVYCHLMFHKCSYRMITRGAPLLERIIAWCLMPFLRRIVYSALYCSKPDAKENSLKIIQELYQEVEEALSDGRPYICGDRFTAADLTFAALSGPVLFPPNYGAWTPSVEEIPPEMARIQAALRKSPAGQHAISIYQKQRLVVVR